MLAMAPPPLGSGLEEDGIKTSLQFRESVTNSKVQGTQLPAHVELST